MLEGLFAVTAICLIKHENEAGFAVIRNVPHHAEVEHANGVEDSIERRKHQRPARHHANEQISLVLLAQAGRGDCAQSHSDLSRAPDSRALYVAPVDKVQPGQTSD